MGRGLNKVMIIGYVGRDPEMRYTPSGRPVTSFSVATSRTWTSAEGERREETEWFNVVSWGNLAEICKTHLSKNQQVYVEGRLQTRGWEDEKLIHLDAQERNRLVISEIQKIWPTFPDNPKKIKVFRWDRAVNLEAPGQYIAIQDMIKNHMDDVEGLYLAGSYLFLIACTEGAMSTGKDAAEKIIAMSSDVNSQK